MRTLIDKLQATADIRIDHYLGKETVRNILTHFALPTPSLV